MMPILVREGRQATHNIARSVKNKRSLAAQIILPTAWRARESAERRPYTISQRALARDDSRMLSAFAIARA